jgi:hypothetical protein
VTHKGNAKGNLHFLYALQFLFSMMNGNSHKVKNYWLDSRKPIDRMTSFRIDAFHQFFSTAEILKS